MTLRPMSEPVNQLLTNWFDWFTHGPKRHEPLLLHCAIKWTIFVVAPYSPRSFPQSITSHEEQMSYISWPGGGGSRDLQPEEDFTPNTENSESIMAAQVTESDQIKQFKEFLGTYNKVTENCFMDCVKDFTTREVKPEETSCSESCLQKYLKMTQRISMRFQEYHIQQNEALAAKAGLLAPH
ncbi:unnamed protein product [Pleuronectes platessa]|uniref:Mitochondrial import inner membrane translocase subunit TIM9 n=1 Tax=Pleuronectes platessa TaxID=8262 RepID=A0A9N7Y870_PLEPL|nr:unnamed protein product [Pleuronectes platessa]